MLILSEFLTIIENNFWVILVFLGIIRLASGIYGRTWLKTSPQEGEEVKSYATERTNNLTMAGFSLAAVALFLTIGFSGNETNLISVTDTVFYLSISLISFITAAYLYGFAIIRWNGFLAGTIEWIGLLSIGIALLIFFRNAFSDDLRFLFLYGVFFLTVYILASKEISLWKNFFKAEREFKTEKNNE